VREECDRTIRTIMLDRRGFSFCGSRRRLAIEAVRELVQRHPADRKHKPRLAQAWRPPVAS
jgi:hypothetical protein